MFGKLFAYMAYITYILLYSSTFKFFLVIKMGIGLVLYSLSSASRNLTETLDRAFLHLFHVLSCVIVDHCVMKKS